MWLPIDELLHAPPLHRDHPRLLWIEADDLRNNRWYRYLSWQVTHPPTPVVWSNNQWYEFHHSLTTGWPYYQGVQVEVYPTPQYPDTEDKESNQTNTQIGNAPAIIDPNGLESPHCPRSNQQGTPSRLIPIDNTHHSNTMSIQTLATSTETIARTIVPGGDGSSPPPDPSNTHQNPQHIRDTFNIALGRTLGGPGSPGDPGGHDRPGGPGGPNELGGIPLVHLIPIHPAADLKPAGIPPLIQHITITLTFIKGPQVDGWVEGILEGLEQLHPVADNIEYTYLNFLTQFETQFMDLTKQETTQAALDHLKFCFPDIDQYISNLKMLAQKAKYTIGSWELMNVFLKGLASAPDIIKCIIDKSLMDYYDLKDKTILVVKNRQLLRAMRNSTAPAFQRPFQCFDSHRPPPQY